MLLTETVAVVEVTVEIAVTTFLHELSGEKKTIVWYSRCLKLFVANYGNRKIATLTTNDLIDWRKDLESKKLSPDTRHGYIRAARKFLRWLFERELLFVDLSRFIKLPRLPKRARKGISDSNVIAILQASKDNLRDYALLNFLESTNARRGGIASLTMDNLALDAPEPLCRRAIVFEKGEEDRTVIISAETLSALRNYFASRKVKSEYVFTNAQGEQLTPDGVSEILQRYKTKLNLRGACSPHQWRHRWCRKRIQDKMPLPQVSQLAGHKSIVVTADFYGTFAIDELQEAFDKYYNPPE